LREILVLLSIDHPFVLPLLGVSTSVKGLGNALCTVFPYSGCSLERGLERDRPRLNQWVRELTQGLDYLHGRTPPVVHANIRASTVLIGANHQIQITGFDEAYLVGIEATIGPTHTGELAWEAPELLHLKNPSRPSRESDIWALACTVCEMYEGVHPYHRVRKGRADDDYNITLKILACERPTCSQPLEPASPSTMPDNLWASILECWNRSPRARPTIHEIRATVESCVPSTD